ncbi:MAG: hypothetical protein A3G13_00660 [Candidatus Levybacteria bacterium RIFCSPLOWO2_12_FULL_37_7]|nr:MAG: hypothetical protein A3G13_00660 [Candidatus Levybacteria bacterium RIFCSPLOWO2_12_FULL_37_7]
MQYQRSVFPNGLRVLTIPMPSFESATVLVMVRAGSRYETRRNNGISHFLEHMAFKVTSRRPSALEISSLVDGIGGEVNAFTGKETTGYYIKSQATHIDLSLDILSDMLQNSLFKTEEIDKERGVILEEINLYEDTPARKIGDVYEKLLYQDTPMGWDIAGEKDVIKSITREDFVQYMESLYSADNITVVVAGGVDSKKAEELVEKYFGKMHAFDIQSYIKVLEKQDKPEVLIKHKKTEQVHIALGVRTVSINHHHKYPLLVLSAILGGGMSSRLFCEVREKRGLAYYVRSSSDHYQDCGSLVTTAGVDAKRVEQAIEVVVQEYNKISNQQINKSTNQQISKEELKKAKEYLKGHMVLELEDSRSVAGFFASQELLEEGIKAPEDILHAIDRITLEDIKLVAKTYLVAEKLNLAVIGDFEDKDRFESLLQLQ